MRLLSFAIVTVSALSFSSSLVYAQNNSITPTGDNAEVSQTNTTTSTNTTIDSTSTNSSTINGTQINNTNTYIVPPNNNVANNGSSNTNANSSIRRRGSDNNWRRDASRPYNRGGSDRLRDRYDDYRDDAVRRENDRINVKRSDGIYTPSNLYRDPSVTGSARTINNRALGDGAVTPRTTGPAAPVYIMTPTGGSVYDSTSAPAPSQPTSYNASGAPSGSGSSGSHYHRRNR